MYSRVDLHNTSIETRTASQNTEFLSDVLQGLSQKHLIEFLNYCALKGHPVTRANIKAWRKNNGVPI